MKNFNELWKHWRLKWGEEKQLVWDILWSHDFKTIENLHEIYIKESESKVDFYDDENYIKSNMIQEIFPIVYKKIFREGDKCDTNSN